MHVYRYLDEYVSLYKRLIFGVTSVYGNKTELVDQDLDELIEVKKVIDSFVMHHFVP
jgi:hypothetical protein